LDPATIRGCVRIDMVTSRTLNFVSIRVHFPPHDDTHFDYHPRLHHPSHSRAVDSSVVPCMYHLIVTSLHEAVSDAICAVGVDDIVEILARRDVNCAECIKS
jgi:hypothetical protein